MGIFEIKGLQDGQIIRLPHFLSDGADVYNGTFTIIESGEYTDNYEPRSLFRDITLEAAKKSMDGAVLRRKFYIVDVKALKDPLVVVANLCTRDCYLEMIPQQ